MARREHEGRHSHRMDLHGDAAIIDRAAARLADAAELRPGLTSAPDALSRGFFQFPAGSRGSIGLLGRGIVDDLDIRDMARGQGGEGLAAWR